MDQPLETDKSFEDTKATSNSIALIKLIEQIVYNYQQHQYGPLAGWDALDKISSNRQQEGVSKTKYLNVFKTTVEVAKASGINFAAMSKPNVEDTMAALKIKGLVSKAMKDDDTYFELDEDERLLVDSKTEEIFLLTSMLSIACNKEHYQSK